MKFFKELKKYVLPTVVALSALSVSASAAFYSVSGLSKLFAGASLEVLIMASSLEISKLVIASLLYQYWDKLNKLLRFYLSIAAGILVIITSMGIYGFLSAAYQETATKSGIIDKEISVLTMKKDRFTENRDFLLEEKKQIDESITSLREGLSNNVIQYKDPETGEIITTTSSSTRKVLQNQLEDAVVSRDKLSNKLEAVTDSITNLDIKILEVETNSDLAGELGPLKYLSELTDKPMNDIINYLLLIIIFVFDPLAISLVIAANFLFKNINEENLTDDLSEKNITIEENIIEEVTEEVEEVTEEVEEEVEEVEEEVEEVEEEVEEVEEEVEEVEEEVEEVEEEVEEVEEEVIEDVKEEVTEEIKEEEKVVEVKNNKRLVYKKRNA
jgi:predicted RNase H-like nuclease (RuvC/YqgF family)